MRIRVEVILLTYFVSMCIVSGMTATEIHSNAVVRCADLKRQKDPILQSLVDKFNNSFALILTPPFKRDGIRVRLQWIGNASVRVGIKAKYLFPAPKIIFHVTPHEEFLIPALIEDVIPTEEIGWSHPFRYLEAKWKEDPINLATYGSFDVLGDPQKIRKEILNVLRVMEHTEHLYSHLLVHYPGDQFNYDEFDDWVNKMFGGDPELTQNLMKHCVQCIYHDHNTPVINVLKEMKYIDHDVRRIQDNLIGFAHSEHPRYDRLHPRLTFHYFKTKEVLLARGSKLWDNLLGDSHCINLIQALAASPATCCFWRRHHFNQSINSLSDLSGFNIIFPGKVSSDSALIHSQAMRDMDVPTCNVQAKSKLLNHWATALMYTRPNITFAAADALRSRVKPKMQKTIGRITKVVHDIWNMMALADVLSVGNVTASNEQYRGLLVSVKLMLENELKFKIPNDRKERKQYIQFWKEFAECIEVEVRQQDHSTVLQLEFRKIGEKLQQHSPSDWPQIDRMLFETLSYWKCIDLRFDPSYDVHVIALDTQRNTKFSREQERGDFDKLVYAMGCPELIDQGLVRWKYYD